MEVNEIYNGDFMSNGLPDHCADLIVADPPYYRVKGDFDVIWDDFGRYLQDVEPFAGSGTACYVAAELGRKYIGYEIDRKYWEIATRRMGNVQMQII